MYALKSRISSLFMACALTTVALFGVNNLAADYSVGALQQDNIARKGGHHGGGHHGGHHHGGHHGGHHHGGHHGGHHGHHHHNHGWDRGWNWGVGGVGPLGYGNWGSDLYRYNTTPYYYYNTSLYDTTPVYYYDNDTTPLYYYYYVQ